MKKIFTKARDIRYWQRKYNTIELKYETLQKSKKADTEKLIELQDKYITLLEKVTDIDKLQKTMKARLNELETKGRK